MCWGNILPSGDLAKFLSKTVGMSVADLDRMDGEKDGMIYPSVLAKKMPERLHDSYPTCDYGPHSGHGVIIINNGDQYIDGNDVILIQTWKDGTFAWLGGTLSKLIDGYERTEWREGEKINKQLPEHKVAKFILEELQRRIITLFADFKKSDYRKIINDALAKAIKGAE